MKKQKHPLGWDAKRVKEVIDHYENQTEEDLLYPHPRPSRTATIPHLDLWHILC